MIDQIFLLSLYIAHPEVPNSYSINSLPQIILIYLNVFNLFCVYYNIISITTVIRNGVFSVR